MSVLGFNRHGFFPPLARRRFVCSSDVRFAHCAGVSPGCGRRSAALAARFACSAALRALGLRFQAPPTYQARCALANRRSAACANGAARPVRIATAASEPPVRPSAS
jgi:hypothetical protein